MKIKKVFIYILILFAFTGCQSKASFCKIELNIEKKCDSNIEIFEDNIDYEVSYPEMPVDPETEVQKNITTKIVNVVKKTPFNTVEKEDENLEQGVREIKQKGVIGREETIYEITYENDKEILRKEIERVKVQEVVDEIVLVGVKFVNKGVLPDNYDYEYNEKLKKEMINLINNHRLENEVHALKTKDKLNKSARYKSLSMLQLNYFSHDNRHFEDTSLKHLIKEYLNYTDFVLIGENLAYKSSDDLDDQVKNIFEALKKSEGHNENMLYSDFEYIGVGIVVAKKSGDRFNNSSVILVTQHFGK